LNRLAEPKPSLSMDAIVGDIVLDGNDWDDLFDLDASPPYDKDAREDNINEFETAPNTSITSVPETQQQPASSTAASFAETLRAVWADLGGSPPKSPSGHKVTHSNPTSLECHQLQSSKHSQLKHVDTFQELLQVVLSLYKFPQFESTWLDLCVCQTVRKTAQVGPCGRQHACKKMLRDVEISSRMSAA
jgi:hypothetical protein